MHGDRKVWTCRLHALKEPTDRSTESATRLTEAQPQELEPCDERDGWLVAPLPGVIQCEQQVRCELPSRIPCYRSQVGGPHAHPDRSVPDERAPARLLLFLGDVASVNERI